MSGVGIEVDVRGMRRVQSQLRKFANAPIDELMDAVGAELQSQTHERITEDKAGPDGEEWPEWSERYAKTRHAGQSLLEGEGALVESLQWVVEDDGLEFGTNLIYGAIHQFGGEEVDIPIDPRPYLGVNDENLDDIEAVIDDWFAQLAEVA